MEKISSIFWFLSLPVFIYVSYRLCLLAIRSYEKTNPIAKAAEKDKNEPVERL